MAQECVTPDGSVLNAADDKTLPVDIPSDVLNKPPVYGSDSESTSDDSVLLQQSEDTDDTQGTTSVESLPAAKRRRTEDEGVYDTTGVQDSPAAKRTKTKNDDFHDGLIKESLPAPKRLNIFEVYQFDTQALCRLASTLRDNVPCTCDVNQRPQYGGYNWAVFITFEDGMRWVMRSPYTSEDYRAAPMNVLSKLLESEAATLMYLKQHSDIPVPQVYSYSSTHDNELGIPYILMGAAKGRPLTAKWKYGKCFRPEVAPEIRTKVLPQLGAITFKLSQLRFDRIGSLFERNGSFYVGECLSRGHVTNERYSIEGISRGPFTSESQFYDSLIEACTQHAKYLSLGFHCFAAPVPNPGDYETDDDYNVANNLWHDFTGLEEKLESIENARDYIIAAEALRDMIPLLQQEVPTMHTGSFALHHPDLTTNNIFVDDNFNITCIIDWQFCSTIPDGMVSIPPGLPQSQHELSHDLNICFREGFEAARAMHQEMTGSSDVQSLAPLETTRCFWLLNRLLTYDTMDDYHPFTVIWKHVYGAEKDLSAYFQNQRSVFLKTGRYKEMLAEDQDDDSPQMAKRGLSDYQMMRHSAAKYLTIMSEWDANIPNKFRRLRGEKMFVADSKVWKWIARVLDDRNTVVNS